MKPIDYKIRTSVDVPDEIIRKIEDRLWKEFKRGWRDCIFIAEADANGEAYISIAMPDTNGDDEMSLCIPLRKIPRL